MYLAIGTVTLCAFSPPLILFLAQFIRIPCFSDFVSVYPPPPLCALLFLSSVRFNSSIFRGCHEIYTPRLRRTPKHRHLRVRCPLSMFSNPYSAGPSVVSRTCDHTNGYSRCEFESIYAWTDESRDAAAAMWIPQVSVAPRRKNFNA